MHQLWKKTKVITVGWRQRRGSGRIWSIKYQIQYPSWNFELEDQLWEHAQGTFDQD